VSPRRPTKDPLDEARAFADEAQSARDDWRRALVAAARTKLAEANVGLADGEAALHGRPDKVSKQLKQTIDRRRVAIEQVADRLDSIERGTDGDRR
jgi:hypothetical protein